MESHVHISGINVVLITAAAIVGLGTLSLVAQHAATSSRGAARKWGTSYIALMSPTIH